jgi:hypothetical protein
MDFFSIRALYLGMLKIILGKVLVDSAMARCGGGKRDKIVPGSSMIREPKTPECRQACENAISCQGTFLQNVRKG